MVMITTLACRNAIKRDALP